jgi:GNAT superfamily N-acetyltransferase
MNRHASKGDDVPRCRIRPRSESDLHECVRVLAEVHEHDGYPTNWPDRPATWLARPDLLEAWVAELDGQVMGHIALSPHGDGDLAPVLWSGRAGTSIEDAAVISRLFVSPKARSRGVGALLVAQAVSGAHERGLHPVLDVVATDTAAAALYERMGWSRLGCVHQRWGQQLVTVHSYASPG